MSASGKSFLGLWLYRSGEREWSVKQGSPIHKRKEFAVIILIIIKNNIFLNTINGDKIQKGYPLILAGSRNY